MRWPRHGLVFDAVDASWYRLQDPSAAAAHAGGSGWIIIESHGVADLARAPRVSAATPLPPPPGDVPIGRAVTVAGDSLAVAGFFMAYALRGIGDLGHACAPGGALAQGGIGDLGRALRSCCSLRSSCYCVQARQGMA